MDPLVWQVLLLAVVQGIAEFLPISSSGHLVILSSLMAEEMDIADVNIVLHVGTLFSILVIYARRVLRLMTEDRRVLGLLFVATLPAVVVGLPLKLFADHVLESALLSGAMLPITGLVLMWVSRQEPRETKYQELSIGRAFLIGLAQAAAILPGLSRSGMTISAGLGVGLSRGSAATFSFLLAIPVIGGAGVLEIASLALKKSDHIRTPGWLLVVGACVSFAVGCGALTGLIRLLERGMLRVFAWWCIPVGIAVVIWQLSIRGA